MRLSLTLINRSWALSRDQRAMNDLYRTRLFCGRIIRLLAHPPSPLCRQQVASFTQSSCVRRSSLLTGEKGGGGGRGAQSYNRPLYINPSILSGRDYLYKVSQLAKKMFTVTSHPPIKYVPVAVSGVYILVVNGYLFPPPPLRNLYFFPLKQRDFRATLPTT